MEHSYLYGISNLQSSTLQIDQQNVQTNFKGDEVVFSESDWSLISTDGRRNDGCGDRDYGEKASTNRSEGVDNGNVTSNGVEKNSSEDQQPRLIPIILQYATNSLVTLKPSRLEQLLDEAATEFQLDRTSIHLAVLIQQIPIKISQSIYSSLGPLNCGTVFA
ncbi:hypothetical protein BY996DRAFT_251938 [Phakopsora pachyrhizi]|nr:hypothetical protein BY996DRAFT_251938 [Phakopsora pachyrhizi]